MIHKLPRHLYAACSVIHGAYLIWNNLYFTKNAYSPTICQKCIFSNHMSKCIFSGNAGIRFPLQVKLREDDNFGGRGNLTSSLSLSSLTFRSLDCYFEARTNKSDATLAADLIVPALHFPYWSVHFFFPRMRCFKNYTARTILALHFIRKWERGSPRKARKSCAILETGKVHYTITHLHSVFSLSPIIHLLLIHV